MTTDRSTIASSVSSACTESAGTVQALAEEVGVSYAALCSWSRGRRRPPPHRLVKLASVLDTRAERLRALADQLRQLAGEAVTPQADGPALTAGRSGADQAPPPAAPARSVIPLAASSRPSRGEANVQAAPGGQRYWADVSADRPRIRRDRPGAIPLPPQEPRR